MRVYNKELFNLMREYAVVKSGYFVFEPHPPGDGIRTIIYYDTHKILLLPEPLIVNMALLLVKTTVEKINPDCIIGIPHTGLKIAQLVGEALNIPCFSWKESRPRSNNPLLIDDDIVTTKTIKQASASISNLSQIIVFINSTDISEIKNGENLINIKCGVSL